MPPEDFLRLAMPFGYLGGPKQDLEKTKSLIKSQVWPLPYLTVKKNGASFQVGMHDGRHRAKAALSLGKPLLVAIKKSKSLERTEPGLSDSELALLVVKKGLLPEV